MHKFLGPGRDNIVAWAPDLLAGEDLILQLLVGGSRLGTPQQLLETGQAMISWESPGWGLPTIRGPYLGAPIIRTI